MVNRGKRPVSSVSRETAIEEALESRRVSLVRERQAELDSVLDRHDTLVREAFHLEKFVSLLSYNPEVAKEDTSAVFEEYKAKYDLLEKATIASGLPRKTRRAHTQRLDLLKGSVSPSITPIARKSKHRASISGSNPAEDPIWDILAGVKGKGKTKPFNGLMNSKGKGKAGADFSETPGAFQSDHNVKVSTRGIKKKFGGATDNSFPDAGAESISSLSLLGGFGRSDGDPNSHTISDIDASLLRPRKRRKTEPVLGLSDESSSLRTSWREAKDAYARNVSRLASADDSLAEGGFVIPEQNGRHPRTRSSTNRTTAVERTETAMEAGGTSVISEVKKPVTRRVTLIVRRPPPIFTNPRQKPLPPRCQKSLSSFMASYTMLDQEDLDQEKLDTIARKNIESLSKYDALLREGKVMGIDVTNPAGHATSNRSADPWDHVVNTIAGRGRPRYPSGRQVASQIANRIRAYWDGQSMRDDKVRIQEEKRLRALAKATIRMVTNEWKKAVHYIREQERSRVEAEERRRGREHLDAILDQSGHILEAQQVDLAKADSLRSQSRSNSMSGSMHDPLMSDRSDESDSVSDAGEESERDSENEVGGDQESEATTNGLLDHETLSTRKRSTSEVSSSKSHSSYSEDHGAILEGSPAFHESPVSLDTPIPPPSPPDDPQDMSPSFVDPFVTDWKNYLQETSSPPDISGQSSPDTPLPFEHSVVSPVHSKNPPDAFFVTDMISTSTDVVNEQTNATSVESEAPVSGDRLASDRVPEPRKLELDSNSSFDALVRVLDDGFGNASATIDSITMLQSMESTSQPEDHHIADDGASSTGGLSAQSLLDSTSTHSDAENVLPDVSKASGVEEVLDDQEDIDEDERVPPYLRPYAVAPVDWDPQDKVIPPLLLRGTLRPYQQSGLEWLASLHTSHLNGILADEMGLGKTIQTIALLAYLACDRGIWGPHLIIVPTSVILNWEMEFKKFLPGFKILSYHGTTKRRKELRQGWNNKYHFNVCITSYTLASRDAHIFKRKPWYYMILDEAHMIKNFKSQRWNILLMFRSFRRLLLTGTPLQNNLTELWALLQFLMSGTNFANVKEFSDWFANPLEKAIELGTALDDETQARVSKLHTVLRPYLLRRLKRDVEKELPRKYEHLVLCPLSKRQRFLYDEFMSRRQTADDLQSGVYQRVANILMQLRKVCNHPDLFEIRSIVTSFAMPRSAISGFEIKELLIRRRLLIEADEGLNLGVLGLQFIQRQNTSVMTALETRRLDGTSHLPFISELPGEPPPRDTRTIAGFRQYRSFQQQASMIARWTHIAYLNRLRCDNLPIYSLEMIATLEHLRCPILPLSCIDRPSLFTEMPAPLRATVKSHQDRAEDMAGVLDRFAFVTPAVVALDMARIALAGADAAVDRASRELAFDALLHRAAVKLQIAFPDPTLLQYDCGKLQRLSVLLKERKAGGHRILIFTQMTKILDILEIFLNIHGYLYLRLDGATKIEDRLFITERFNADPRIFCFIASSRSGGVGINLTGADTVIFYDSDFNPQMDRQCEDRAHRIGQIRDVHIYRFISQHTVEEALLRKANQKRSLDDLVIQKGEFDWRTLFGEDQSALTKALGEFEDQEDAHAADVAAREEIEMVGADEVDFGAVDAEGANAMEATADLPVDEPTVEPREEEAEKVEPQDQTGGEVVEEEEGGTTADYMLSFMRFDYDFFKEWKL